MLLLTDEPKKEPSRDARLKLLRFNSKLFVRIRTDPDAAVRGDDLDRGTAAVH